MNTKINIGIVEDQSALRKRLIEHLGFYEDIDVTISAGNGDTFLARMEHLPVHHIPDIILMDIELPGMSGIETTCLLKENYPQTDILMFTVFEDDDSIFDSIKAGASGYLLKDLPVDDIVNAIRELKQGGAPISPIVAKKILLLLHTADVPSGKPVAEKSGPAPFNLTNRELEILQDIVLGKTNGEIGAKLFLSPWTIKTHVKNIYKKMHVSNRAEVTRLAIKRNLV